MDLVVVAPMQVGQEEVERDKEDKDKERHTNEAQVADRDRGWRCSTER